MTMPPDPMTDPLLEEYLDDALPADERLAFESTLDHDAKRSRAVDAQKAIDASLRRNFTPPDAAALRARLDRARSDAGTPELRLAGDFSGRGPTPDRSGPSLRRWVAAAAALVLAAVGVWQGWSALRPAGPGGYGPWRSLDAIYAQAEQGGLDVWQCSDDQEFADTFRGHYQQPLVLGELPDDVAALGLAYRNALSPRSTCLLAMVRDEPVVVVIDRIERDAGGRLEPDSDLRLYRRRVGQLVLFEVSRLDAPVLLEHLSVPGLAEETP